ncbi:MAG: T9SS type A sorting domain-containing protein [Bacteroidetes bacterium]|nr:T9SS type A sorting domain-containing protein [Bacteroidota bacterium]
MRILFSAIVLFFFSFGEAQQACAPNFFIGNDTCLEGIPKIPIQLNPNLSCATGSNCNVLVSNDCGYAGSIVQFGTNTLTAVNNPTPFRGYWEDGKGQYLFRASELQAMGFQNGLLRSLAFNFPNVSSNNGYANLTIKLKCTTTNVLAVGAFESGAITVYNSALFTPVAGWNTLAFNAPYIYDGTSNLLVEVCYNNSGWSADDNIEYSTTPFVSSVTMDQDGMVGCAFATSELAHNSRPNMRFNYSANVNPANYTISWNPTTGISDPTSLNPTVTPPLGATSYVLSITTLDGLCVTTDTITYFVGEGSDFTISSTLGDTIRSCSDLAIPIPTSTSVPGTYTYAWSPSTFLDQSTIASPTATITIADTINYTVYVSTAIGCRKSKTISVITQRRPPAFTIGNDTCLTSIPKTPIQLSPNLSCASGQACNVISSNPCSSNGTTIQIGTGNLTNVPNPTPFMGFWEDGKAQYILRASELQALGIQDGIINSIAFNFLNVASTNGYTNLTIKLKCTTTNQFIVGPFESGAITVYNTTLYTPTVGWNTFNFTSPYVYDGTSNLLVEMCFDNTAWSADDNIEYSALAFAASATMDQDAVAGCNFTNSEEIYNARPNMKINYSANVNPANYIINWNPTTGISDPNILTPTVIPDLGSTTYTLSISTLDGQCTETNTITFHINEFDLAVQNQPIGDTVCIGQTISLLTTTVGTALSYQWKKSGVNVTNSANISGATTANLSITNASLANQGWYSCTITGACSQETQTISVYIKVNACVSLDEISKEQFSLYPNPTNSSITISLPRLSNDYDEIIIINVLGQEVLKQKRSNSLQETIDVSNLRAGFYSIELRGENKKLVQSFIKE